MWKKRLILFRCALHAAEVMGSEMVGRSFNRVAATAASMLLVVGDHYCRSVLDGFVDYRCGSCESEGLDLCLCAT